MQKIGRCLSIHPIRRERMLIRKLRRGVKLVETMCEHTSFDLKDGSHKLPKTRSSLLVQIEVNFVSLVRDLSLTAAQ